MSASRSARPARGGALTIAPLPAILLGRSTERKARKGRRAVEEQARGRHEGGRHAHGRHGRRG
jgi:hypothetical protein